MTKEKLNTYLNKYVKITFDEECIKIWVLKLSKNFKKYLLSEEGILFGVRQVKHIKIIKERKNKTPGEIKAWLLENCVDENNNINLSRLDFSDFDGEIIINHLKVKRHLFQNHQTVGGSLFQHNQICKDYIFQDFQKAKRIVN